MYSDSTCPSLPAIRDDEWQPPHPTQPRSRAYSMEGRIYVCAHGTISFYFDKALKAAVFHMALDPHPEDFEFAKVAMRNLSSPVHGIRCHEEYAEGVNVLVVQVAADSDYMGMYEFYSQVD